MSDLIDDYDPNKRGHKHAVEIVLQAWGYRATELLTCGGNCMGATVLEWAVDALCDRLAEAGSAVLTDAEGRQLLTEPDGEEDYEAWVKDMIVSVRIVEVFK